MMLHCHVAASCCFRHYAIAASRYYAIPVRLRLPRRDFSPLCYAHARCCARVNHIIRAADDAFHVYHASDAAMHAAVQRALCYAPI